MATVQENKETIIKSFNDMKQDINTLETSKVSNEQLEPIAKAAFEDYPLWAPQTEYKTGDMIYVLDVKRNKMTARVIQNHTSASVENPNNPRNWVKDFKAGNLQIIPTLDSDSAQNMSISEISGRTMDAFVIKSEFGTVWNFLGDWEELNAELSETNNYTEIVNILHNKIKSLEETGPGDIDTSNFVTKAELESVNNALNELVEAIKPKESLEIIQQLINKTGGNYNE